MSTNDKKDKNEELFDHIIEYGAGRWTDEISPDNIPEEELSDQLNQKIDTIFSSARKRANRKRRFITARRIAAVFVVLFTMASVTVMSVEAFRVPVLNFIFKTTKQNKVLVKFQNEEKDPESVFQYIPIGYHFKQKRVTKNGDFCIYQYKDNEKNSLYIQINYNIDSNSYTNLDKTGYTQFKDNQIEYYYLEGSYNQLLWYRNKCIFKISSKLTKKEMLKIANGIRYQFFNIFNNKTLTKRIFHSDFIECKVLFCML